MSIVLPPKVSPIANLPPSIKTYTILQLVGAQASLTVNNTPKTPRQSVEANTIIKVFKL